MELPASIKKGLWTDGLCELKMLIFDNPFKKKGHLIIERWIANRREVVTTTVMRHFRIIFVSNGYKCKTLTFYMKIKREYNSLEMSCVRISFRWGKSMTRKWLYIFYVSLLTYPGPRGFSWFFLRLRWVSRAKRRGDSCSPLRGSLISSGEKIKKNLRYRGTYHYKDLKITFLYSA